MSHTTTTQNVDLREAKRLARQEAKKQAKELARIESEKNQKEVKEITITIEWVKSRMWGSNPNCEAVINFKDGSFERSPIYKASGCGYDKESTVIAQVFNAYLKYKLWQIDPSRISNSSIDKVENPLPYGIAMYYANNPHYSGGVGTSCYYRIGEAIGGKFEHIASGKTFDVYKYTDN